MTEGQADRPEDAAPPSLTRIWIEVLALTVAGPLLGLLIRPADPLFVRASFPWLQIAPLLIALRHGFARGTTSALLLGLALAADWRLRHAAEFPSSLALGVLLGAMLAGEFCDAWRRRIARLDELCRHQQAERERFGRAYNLLTLSHDRLERRVQSNPRSMREALTNLRRLALARQGGSLDAPGLWQAIAAAFASYGDVQVGALFRVEDGVIDPTPIVALGGPAPLDNEDPLWIEALRCGAVVSAAGVDRAVGSRLLLAVPLTDVGGRVRGLVAVEELPFLSLTDEHLRLLALIGGLAGDALGLAGSGAEEDFRAQLARWQSNARSHGLPCTLAALRFPDEATLARVLVSHRELDQPWLTRDRDGQPILLLLLPLTDEDGAQAWRARLDSLFAPEGGLARAGVRITHVAVDGRGDPLAVLAGANEARGEAQG